MAVIPVLLVLVVVHTIQSQTVSVNITRGDQDIARSDSPIVAAKTNTCERDRDCYRCDVNRSTFIYEWRRQFGKCVEDEAVIQHQTGKYLPDDRSCLGVSDDDNIVHLSCTDKSLSAKWLWTQSGHMQNLKNLMCLEVEKKESRKKRMNGRQKKMKKRKRKLKRKRRRKREKKQEFILTLNQCDTKNPKQSWECQGQMVHNKGFKRYRKSWIMGGPRSEKYFSSCENGKSSFEGCYRFSNGRFIHLVGREDKCTTQIDGNCSLEIEIRAPINKEYSICSLNLRKSSFSKDGHSWHLFEKEPKGFSLYEKESDEITLTIKDKNAVLTEWPGHLVRLEAECNHQFTQSKERHCILLKIEGNTTIHKPLSKKPTLSSPSFLSFLPSKRPSEQLTAAPDEVPEVFTPTDTEEVTGKVQTFDPPITLAPTDSDNKNSEDGESDESDSKIVPIVAPIIAVLSVLLFAVVLALFYLRRKSRLQRTQESNEHVYEETTPQYPQIAPPNGVPSDSMYQAINQRPPRPNVGCRPGHGYSEPTTKNGHLYHTLEKPEITDSKEEGIYQELDEALRTPEPVYKGLEHNEANI